MDKALVIVEGEVTESDLFDRVARLFAATRLKQLDALKEQGLITEAEYTEKRGKILAEL